MIIPYTAAFTTVFALLIYQQDHIYILITTLVISLIYYAQLIYQSQIYDWSRLWKGDFIFQIAFIAYLHYYKIPYFMHYIPLLLSNVGKIHWIANQKSGEVTIVIQ